MHFRQPLPHPWGGREEIGRCKGWERTGQVNWGVWGGGCAGRLRADEGSVSAHGPDVTAGLSTFSLGSERPAA